MEFHQLFATVGNNFLPAFPRCQRCIQSLNSRKADVCAPVWRGQVVRRLVPLISSTCLVREQGATVSCCVSLAFNQHWELGTQLQRTVQQTKLCPQHPAADLMQHNRACTSKKLNVLSQVVIGNLGPPSGLQWTRN